ncbi:protein at-4/1 [Quercus suber]|uniref:Protein at-4/1 n=1 Tax=Quercus suber TaxID=58331 RepID=A0AAW0IH40_QUESU
MAGSSSEEEMESVLLPNFDLIYQDFKNAIAEIELLKSNSNAELKIREALQFTSHSLRQELKRVSDERLHQEYEHRKSMDLLKRDYMTKVGDLEAQIQGLLLEKATNEATINLLCQDLTAHKTYVQTVAKRLDHVHFDVESKYDLEIQDLRDCLMIE